MSAHRSKPRAAPLTVASAWPDTMGLEHAADYLRLGRDATRALWERGELPGVSLNQKHLVFRRVALDKFLADLEVQQASERLAQAQAMDAANDAPPGAQAPAGPRGGRKRTTLPDLKPYEAAGE